VLEGNGTFVNFLFCFKRKREERDFFIFFCIKQYLD
jgi:hypothetical protein